jgi:proteasome lid subunit RPN8/RPN11
LQYTLWLSEDYIEQLLSHAEASLPLEAAALLFGRIENNSIIVTTISLVNNETKSRINFEINPEEEYRLILEAEKRNEEMVCIFHSHPAPATPSSSDLENMKLNPVVWLIASKISGWWENRAYILENEKIVEVTIKTNSFDSSA